MVDNEVGMEIAIHQSKMDEPHMIADKLQMDKQIVYGDYSRTE